MHFGSNQSDEVSRGSCGNDSFPGLDSVDEKAMKMNAFKRWRTGSAVLGLFSLLLLVCGCSKSPAELQKKYMSLGEHYLAEGKLNEAVIEFQNLLKVNPKSAQGHYELGKAYQRKGWLIESVIQYREAVKLAPLMLDAHLSLAQYAINSGQWNPAKSEISAILKIDPSNARGWTYAGQRMSATGREAEAQKDLEHALSLKPGYPRALVAMGDLKRKQNHLKQAKDYYDKALSSAPSNSRAWAGLGLILQAKGKNDEALADFKKALAVDPDNLRSHIILANFMASQGHLHKAVSELESIPSKKADLRIPIKIAEYETLLGENQKAIAILQPLSNRKIQIPDIDYVLAKAYEQAGKKNDALQEVSQLIMMNNVPVAMQIGAARIDLAEGKPHDAQTILDNLKNTPNLPLAYALNQARVALALNHPANAVKVLNAALRQFPENPGLLLTLADSQSVQKQWARALQSVQKVLDKDPANNAAIFRKGILLGRLRGTRQEENYFRSQAETYPAIEPLYLQSLVADRQLPQALSESRHFLAAHPDSKPVQLFLAQLYNQTGHPQKSQAVYQKVLATDPNNLRSIVSLASLAMNNRRFPEAEAYFRRAIRLAPNNGSLYSGLGEALLGENQRDAATKTFEKALSLTPNDAIALLEVSKSEILRGQGQEALTHLAPLLKASLNNSQKAEVDWLWGLANERAGDSAKAESSLAQAVRLAPQNADYHASMGDYWSSVSRWAEAEAEYKKSLSLNPRNTLLQIKGDWIMVQSQKHQNPALIEKVVREAANYRKDHPQDMTAPLLEAQGDIFLKKQDEALGLYNSILAVQPDNTSARLGKSGLLADQGHLRQAQKILEAILADHPDNLPANLMMAQIDRKAGKIPDEAEHLEKIHQQHPDWIQPSLALVAVDLALKRFREAKSISGSLLETNPGLDQARYLKSRAELGLEDYSASLHDLGILVKRAKKPAPLLIMMSVAAMKERDAPLEKKFLDQALKASPDNPIALNNMAFYLAEHSGNLNRALDYAKKAVSIDKQPFIQDTVGYILFRMGKYSEAESYFKTAWDAHFRDPEFLYHRGMNEWKLGNKTKARKFLRNAKNSGKLTVEEETLVRKALSSIAS